jgi:hypothetical protein
MVGPARVHSHNSYSRYPTIRGPEASNIGTPSNKVVQNLNLDLNVVRLQTIMESIQRLVCQSGFTTLPPASVLEQPAMVHCWSGLGLSSSKLGMMHSGHDDLHGSGGQSETPYAYGRCVYYCLYGAIQG